MSPEQKMAEAIRRTLERLDGYTGGEFVKAIDWARWVMMDTERSTPKMMGDAQAIIDLYNSLQAYEAQS